MMLREPNAHFFPELNWHILTFLHQIFYCVQVHILSTTEEERCSLTVPSESAREKEMTVFDWPTIMIRPSVEI
jgi:hypothetical protein